MKCITKQNGLQCTVMLALFLLVNAICIGKPGKQLQSDDKGKLTTANKAADRFIKRFRETLDVGIVFDEMAVSDAIPRLRKAHPRQFGWVQSSLLDSIDDLTARRLYVATTNSYYMGLVYSAKFKGSELIDDHAPMPPKLRELVLKSHWLRGALDESDVDIPGPASMADLLQYICEWERAAAIYKELIPPDVFDSSIYKENIEILKSRREGPEIEVFDSSEGFESLGLKEHAKVYFVRRDLFTLMLIEENSEFRILGFDLSS